MNLTQIIKRNGRVVPFEPDKISKRIYQAAASTGGFKQDIELLPPQLARELYHPYLNLNEQQIAEKLTDQVVSYLEFYLEICKIEKPSVENTQDTVEYVLADQAFIDVWETYRLYRSSRIALRKKQITEDQFSRSGLPDQKCQEIEEWNKKHNCHTISALNELVKDPKAYQNLIESSIQAYEDELDKILLTYLKNPARIVIITGPSSSGKTTTTNKVIERLEQEGFECKLWTLDNYYKGLKYIPQDKFGDYNYETPETLDIRLIRKHLHQLFEGKEVKAPFYNFLKGKRDGISTKLKLENDAVLVVDSLYSISPKLFSERILPEEAFKVYIETLNMLEDSTGRKVKLTDNRMLRRMVRDSSKRGHSIELTLGHWHYVRKGELRDLIPYLNTADYIINGSLAFELPILKGKLHDKIPDLEQYKKQKRWDALIRGHRIKRLFGELASASDKYVPSDCHLREFIGPSI